ncbi:helix-turn-helix transcriptional regulator [Saccharothrix deserti]|uniref:helix-turn-helix transcriptional regulator n=1 Tax=Saccharothrix deserti TaxID=2593674 RepID=UPI00192E55C8|nr:LuxR C-terminal-related transcriptional regulator [Saccharothrix deserti]
MTSVAGLSLLRERHDVESGRCFNLSEMNAGLVDARLVLRSASNEFAALLGIAAEDLTGRDFVDLFRGEVRPALRGRCARLLAQRRGGFTYSAEIVRVDRAPSAVEVVAVAVRRGLVVTVSSACAADAPQRILSDLDARILEAIAVGESTAGMACRLYLSRQGVEYHVGTMLRKLGAVNRATLVSRAFSRGILDAGSWPPRVVPDYVKQS